MTRSPDSLIPFDAGQPAPKKRDEKAFNCRQEGEANLRAATEVNAVSASSTPPAITPIQLDLFPGRAGPLEAKPATARSTARGEPSRRDGVEGGGTQTQTIESDTPRRAGGLMSWAASKAVGVLSRRRALRASVRSSELPAGTIRGVLLADVLAHLLQVESDCGHRVTAGPEVFAGEVSLLSAQACNRNGTLPLQEPNHRGDWVLGWNRDTHVHMGPASDALPQSGLPSVSPTRGKLLPIAGVSSRRSLSGAVWERIPRDTCSPTWSGLGFDTDPTLDPPWVGHQAT